MVRFWENHDGFRQQDRNTLSENRKDVKEILQVIARLEQRVEDDFRNNKEWRKARKIECDLILKELRNNAESGDLEAGELTKAINNVKREVDRKTNMGLGRKAVWALIATIVMAAGSIALAAWSLIKTFNIHSQ